ncbi:family 78 glycoside hydrolase catalytic domain [Ruminiclostridium cellobioparum]|uniref:alpha-L-rhamnosidase n=1 Tax=Ruminiclostridium cellobioparum subsp. termitidis CT1112 TaxID=1195236 RepID=S0FJR5_RUMCE|nr:family 78 glycoside hydrolase catalytic domain [Ruminiclostridium cellobioparum]EMS69344.1 Alpha-L-rhamnosidase N-terminal domain/Bacterial alpha-L-rhamnosidase [Ruminiclostridium cellobioparum subsp. termitidis CT1112]
MEKIWKASWIIDGLFEGLTPLNVFHKQLDTREAPKHMEHLKNHHMLVRKEFVLTRSIGHSYLDISADDYYKLYINGRFIGQGPAPAYHFQYNYNRYEVSKYLRKGNNVIAVHVYYQGLVNRVWNSGDYRQGLIAELFVSDKLYLKTDATWKYTRANEFVGTEVFGYETQYNENIDQRLKESGWRECGYPDEIWQKACVKLKDDHRLIIQQTPPLEIYEIKPMKVVSLAEGHYLIDFGQEITGQFKMRARGEPGQTIEVLCGEELEENDFRHVRFKLRCNCIYRELWTLSGGDDVLEYYDYKAFRYAEVVGPAQCFEPDSFSAIVRHYPFAEDRCIFHSSSPLLNAVWGICKNGVKYGAQEVFVDCPSREKGQYLGDATVTTHAHLYLSGDLRLFKKTLQDFAASSFICPGLMAVAPGSFMQEIADFSLQWPLQLLNYYHQSGELAFLEEMYPVAEGILQYFKKFQRTDGLLENVKEKWNLVDWPQNLRDEYDFDLSEVVGEGCHNVINSFYIGAVKTVNEIKRILGDRNLYDLPRLEKAYQKAFYREELKLFADSTVSGHTSLHSNMLALFFGLAPEEAKNSIVELIKDKKLNCGVYNTYFLLKGLANAGEYELIYQLITLEDIHSWGNMLKEGATTCFEAWGKDQKWNTSLCHPWASSPIPVIIEDILGLKPLKPGWEEISFTPHIPAVLEHISLEIQTVKGRIRVSCVSGKAEIFAPEGIKISYANG